MLKTWAWIFAVAFIVIGILGFVPGITTADGHLLGIFEVDPLHNIIHLLSGLVALFVVFGSAAAQQMYFKVFGIVYLLVTIIGFVQGDTVLGLINTNMADHILHLLIAIVSLWLGFGKRHVAAPAPQV